MARIPEAEIEQRKWGHNGNGNGNGVRSQYCSVTAISRVNPTKPGGSPSEAGHREMAWKINLVHPIRTVLRPDPFSLFFSPFSLSALLRKLNRPNPRYAD